MKNKWIKIGGVLLILGIVGLVVAKKSGWIGSGKEIKVSAEKVSHQTITEIVSANGKVQPEKELKISSDVSGEVVELFVKEGDFVTKGTLLCRINPEIYISELERNEAVVSGARSQVENSKSSLSQAQAEFQKADLAYKRNKKLYEDGVISQADFDNIRAAYEIAKAAVDASKQTISGASFNVKSAEAGLKQSKESLNKTSIYAPVDGTISKLSKEKGERVVGTNMMEGTEILRLANLNEMEVIVDVSENDIVRVHLGDTSEIEVDAYNDRKFIGTVTEIANSANSNDLSAAVSTDQVINFKVKVRILRESYQDLIPANRPDQSPFRPGMSATVDIQTKRVVNVIAVPVQAVTTRDTTIKESSKTVAVKDDMGEPIKQEEQKPEDKTKVKECVFIIENGIAKQVVVKTGIQDNNYIQIEAGLKDSQQVITGPYNIVSKTLKEGDKVEIVDKSKLFLDKKAKK